MKNRKLPFGYRMEMGEIVLRPQERPVVQTIFRMYIDGAAFNRIVAWLKDQDVPYDEGRLWNKNMVARILGDSRYIGENGFPAIIASADMVRVTQIREAKQCAPPKTDVQKILRRLSGHTATEQMEQQTLELLNGVIGRQEKIRQPEPRQDESTVLTLRQQLDAVMERQPVAEDQAKDLIFKLAAAQYDCIDSTEYETVRLRRVFAAAKPMEKLDAKLLQSTVRSIELRGGTMLLHLKNDQILGGDPK